MRKFKWLGILLGVLLVFGCSSLVLAQEEESPWEKDVTIEVEFDTAKDDVTITSELELEKDPLTFTIEWEKETTSDELGTIVLGCEIENWAFEWEKELEADDSGIFVVEYSFSF